LTQSKAKPVAQIDQLTGGRTLQPLKTNDYGTAFTITARRGRPRGVRSATDELELRANVDRAFEAARHRTETSVEAVHALDLLAAVLRHRQPVSDRDAADHEHLFVELDLADGLDLVLLGIDFDVTRFQRAGERAGQSPARGGDHVVERGRARRILLGRHAVVLGDLGVHAEHDRLIYGRQVREPLRTAETLDLHARDIDGIAVHVA
jgi:hypothetical protein